MKTDKELADELDAWKRLREHGYVQKNCTRCGGVGHLHISGGYCVCFACEGKGYTWEAPFMRTTERR